VSDIHEGRTWPQRWNWAANFVLSARGPAFASLPKLSLLLIALSCTTAVGAAVTFLIVIPYYTLWALLFSYELRTMATVIPFAALSSGIGVQRVLSVLRLVGRSSRVTDGTRRMRLSVHPVLLMALVILAAGIIRLPGLSDRAIVAQQHEQQVLLGDAALNRRLIDYFRAHPEPGRVACEYYYFGVVPEILSRSQLIPFPQNFQMRDVERVQAAVPGSRYLMFVEAKRPAATREAMKRAGYSEIFCHEPFCFVRVPDAAFQQVIPNLP
jgi:hypothetical protein